MATFKETVKKTIRRGLGRPELVKGLLRDTVSIFVYHEVSKTPSPFCQRFRLNVPPQLFEEHMRFINANFNVITPDDLLKKNYETPAAMITFDDGMPGYFRQAVPIMAKHNISSIIFLNMGPIEGEIFWAGIITYLTLFDAKFQKIFLEKYFRLPAEADYLLCETSMVDGYLKRMGRSAIDKIRLFYGEFASLKDLEDLRGNPSVFFGNHFYNHYNTLKLSNDEIKEQYTSNEIRILKYSNGRRFFAYPFGQPGLCFNDSQTQYLRSLGAQAIFSSSGDINRKDNSNFYDRIGVDSYVETSEDLFGRIQWKRLKNFKRGFRRAGQVT